MKFSSLPANMECVFSHIGHDKYRISHVSSNKMGLLLRTRVRRAHYPHANGEPLLKRRFSLSILPCSATILLVVWSANGDGLVVLLCTSKVNLLSGRYLPMELSDCNYVILQTNRVRCALNRKIFNLLNEESVSGESSGRACL